MEPFRIILAIFFVDGRKISCVPDLSIVEKVGAWCLAEIAMCASEMEDGLYGDGVAFFDDDWFLFMSDGVVVGFVHIDMVGYDLVGSSSGEVVADVLELGRVWEEKFMMLNVFVEWEDLGFGRRIVGVEELEVEVVLVDGYVEDEANTAH